MFFDIRSNTGVINANVPGVWMKTLTDVEFHAACVEQANSFADLVVVCPACKRLQMGQDFLDAGLSRDEAKSVLGFSCIGGHTTAPSQPGVVPCDFTFGDGAGQRHRLVIVTPSGTTYPHFELANIKAAVQYRSERQKIMRE